MRGSAPGRCSVSKKLAKALAEWAELEAAKKNAPKPTGAVKIVRIK